MNNLHYSDEKNILLMVALLKAHNIRRVIASPGTTNITFIGSLMHDPFFEMYSSVDERSAAYIACGMAEESGEPVVISCTGATASRNYLPGLTEAYYRKLPVLAITSTREECKIGHLIDQQIDRTQIPKDACVCSEHLQVIKDDEDMWNCTIKINRAILALRQHGGGPTHINLPTTYSKNFSVLSLPKVKKISRYYPLDNLPKITQKKVAVFIGTHKKMRDEEILAIDKFCECYNAVVFRDICSGYHGKYGLNHGMLSGDECLLMDLLIHIGEVSAAAYSCKPKEVWRVSEDGELRDTYRKLTNVFEMSEFYFFTQYVKGKETIPTTYYKECFKKYDDIQSRIQDVPFSNGWITNYLRNRMPHNSILHLGIASTLYSWNSYNIADSINVNCNQGGFGIDGNMSSLLGAALVHPEKLCFCVLGDLAFFYDMNVLGNRHINKNIRILLINNGNGVIFRKPGNIGSIFEDETPIYISASGHFGNQSHTLVKSYAESLGFEYMSASEKDDFIINVGKFLKEEMSDKPMLFEVFVTTENEIKGDKNKPPRDGLKKMIHDFIGPQAYNVIKGIVKPDKNGQMSIDKSGSNK